MLIKTPGEKKEIKPNKRKKNGKKKKTSQSKSAQSHKNYGQKVDKKESKLSLPRIAPWKIIIGVVLLGGIGVLYLHHVFATQRLLHKVQAMERTYEQTKRNYKLVRIKYDRLTGPIKITKKAQKMGFVSAGPAKEIIEVKPE